MFKLMGSDWSVCQNLNICNMFWMNHIQMSQCRRKVATGRRVASTIRSLVSDRGLQLE